MGRLVTLKTPVSINELVSRVKAHLGLQHIQVALAPDHRKDMNAPLVKTIGLCAGSGGSVLRGCKADVHFTGELGHHEALGLVESGVSALVCGHSNTERGFLARLQKTLASELEKDWKDGPIEVLLSSSDRDPLEIV